MRKVRFSAIPVGAWFYWDGWDMYKVSESEAWYSAEHTAMLMCGSDLCEVDDNVLCVGSDAQDDPVVARKGGEV